MNLRQIQRALSMAITRLIPAITVLLISNSGLRAQCCDHILSMQDSYGDGWNGGNLQVSINGSVIGSFAATGYSSSATFTVCDGDPIQLDYTPLDWENENTYTLFDQWGGVVFSDGPTPGTGTVFTGVGVCGVEPDPGTVPCMALPIDTVDCVTVDNTGIEGTGIAPGCAEYAGGDLWFAMPVPASGNVYVASGNTGGLNDTGIALWTGTSCFDITNRGCDDDSGLDYFSAISGFELPQGQTLFIQVYGYGGGTGEFELCVTDLGTIRLDSSDLPIVSLFTQGQEIPYDGKVDALMEIRYNGPGNITYVTDPPNVYAGNIGLGLRGASSGGYPQRPYALETRDANGENLDAAILGMPEENDWVLLSNYNDRSLVRNELAFDLARRMGQYAPRTHLCEVLLDSSYRGIYVFGEKIKRDGGRVDIAKLTGDENEGDDLTGGYILQQNYWDANTSFQSNFSPIDHPDFDVHFVYEYPAPDTISTPQRTYIATYVDSLETALYGADFTDPVNGYRKYLDVPSFINYFLVNELSRNNDGFKKSVYFHKDKFSNGGTLKAGPVWDFDWAWKNLYGCDIFDNIDGSGWAHLINDCPTDNYSCGWYVRLLQDSTFNQELGCAYDQYRTTALSTESIFAYIDSIGARVQNAQARHFQKWQILGVSGPAPEVLACATTYNAELDTLKGWIAQRLGWLDANIPGTCTNVGVAENTPAALNCYPNPTAGVVRFSGVDAATTQRSIVIQDVTGRELHRIVVPPGVISIEHTFRESGTFLFTLREGEVVLRTGRLVVL